MGGDGTSKPPKSETATPVTLCDSDIGEKKTSDELMERASETTRLIIS